MTKTTLAKPLLAMIGLLAIVSAASGQSPTPPEPRQPLLPRAPARASWSVAFKYAGEEKPADPAIQPRPLGEVPRSIVITKVNDVYREQIDLATGKKMERWDFDGTLFTSNTAGTVFLIIPPTEDTPSPDYYDRRRSDFPELNWISKATYRGIGSFQGKQAFHFETEKDGTTLSAYLSLDSQMPLWFSDGTTTRTYTFNPPPAGPLEPPPAFSIARNRHKQAMDALKYRPSPP
jgi:hypothetical protein